MQVDDAALANKLTSDEKNSIREICTKTIAWISEHDQATEEEYSHKKQEVESICRPITLRLYSNATAAGFVPNLGRQFPNSESSGAAGGGVGGVGGGGGGPIIDEAD